MTRNVMLTHSFRAVREARCSNGELEIHDIKNQFVAFQLINSSHPIDHSIVVVQW